MTAIRNFPDAPALLGPSQPLTASLRSIGQVIWQGLLRVGHQRAAGELYRLANSRVLRDPAMAEQLRAAADACRRAAAAPQPRN